MASIRRSNPSSTLVDALAGVALFADLPKRKLQQIADMCREHRFEPGEAIVQEGDTSGRFYVVIEGGAEVQVHGRAVRVLGPGQHFGEYAVIDRAPRSASVVALTPVLAYSLAPTTLRPLLKEEPELTYRLLLNACQRIRALESAGG
ncbi:MAG: cyclic nucleotide-binding domain-containing protein [Acidimicrobiales bacterium]